MKIALRITIDDVSKVTLGLANAVNRDIYGGRGSGPGVANANNGGFNWMFGQWAKIYEVFTRRRFTDASRGDGTWAPLARSTADRRLAGKVGKGTRGSLRKALQTRLRLGTIRGDKARYAATLKVMHLASGAGVAILKNTGSLFAALSIGLPGNTLLRRSNRVVYGFASQRHPKSKGPTFAQIAIWQDGGTKTIPARPILVQPPGDVLAQFKAAAVRAIHRVIAESKGGA